jgi:glycosyltransferase involved in cell wall biosynthesis
MKILLINTFFPPIKVGGAEESVFELAAGLRHMGHEVAVACLGPRRNSEPEIAPHGVNVYRLNTKIAAPFFSDRSKSRLIQKILWHAREVCRPSVSAFLRRILRAEKPDVIHTNSIAGFGLAAWRVARDVPLVHTAREYHLVCASSRTYRNGSNCQRQCLDCKTIRAPFSFARRKPDLFVGLTRATIVRHEEFGFLSSDSDSFVIANQPTLPAFTRSRREGGGATFGYIGRLEDYKGLYVALEAFANLRHGGVKLLIAGDGSSEDLDHLARLMERDKRVEFLGRVSQGEFFSRVDVVVVPSQWHEPFGRVAAEACVAGAAAIVSDVGGLPEAIRGYPHGGLVRDFTSPDAWTEAMKGFIDFRADSPPDASRRHSKSVAAQYEELYLGLVQRSGT